MWRLLLLLLGVLSLASAGDAVPSPRPEPAPVSVVTAGERPGDDACLQQQSGHAGHQLAAESGPYTILGDALCDVPVGARPSMLSAEAGTVPRRLALSRAPRARAPPSLG